MINLWMWIPSPDKIGIKKHLCLGENTTDLFNICKNRFLWNREQLGSNTLRESLLAPFLLFLLYLSDFLVCQTLFVRHNSPFD